MNLFDVVLVGTVAAVCVAATSASPELALERNDPIIVPKTVISSTMRFYFPVGLEGTGHHYFMQVERQLFRTHRQLVDISHDVKPGDYAVDRAMGTTAESYVEILKTARNNMQRLAQQAAELKPPGTVSTFSARYSYPNGYGPNKALHYVDLRLLAEIAEETGVDFRVLYLRRPVKDMIVANTIHRRFQDHLGNEGNSRPAKLFMGYMQILMTDIGVLHALLAEIGPGFVVCHDYDLLGDADQAGAIAEFLAPNDEVATMLNKTFVAAAKGHLRSSESLPFPGADAIAARLQRKFDAFEWQLCSRTKPE